MVVLPAIRQEPINERVSRGHQGNYVDSLVDLMLIFQYPPLDDPHAPTCPSIDGAGDGFKRHFGAPMARLRLGRVASCDYSELMVRDDVRLISPLIVQQNGI